MSTLRLLSYNVRSLRDDPAAVARVMRAAEPDVAIVQEAPRFLRWRSSCAALARRAGLLWVSGGRAAGANLVLSHAGGPHRRAISISPSPTSRNCIIAARRWRCWSWPAAGSRSPAPTWT